MGTSCFRAENGDDSVFNVLRKITNTMRDLEIKENRLTNDRMPKKRAKMVALMQEGRQTQARVAFVTFKKYQSTRDQYWNLRENLERIKHEIDTAHTNVVVAEGFKQANITMERLLTTTSLADVDSIIDKCKSHMEQGEAIFDALSAPLDESMDVDALDTEMEELMRIGNPPPKELELPSVPSNVPAIKKHTKRSEQDDLKTPLLQEGV